MPRPSINLEPFREAITELWEANTTTAQLVQYLNDEHDLSVGISTLKTHLKRWGLVRQVRTVLTTQLQQRIHELYFELGLSDDELLSLLTEEGFTVSMRGLAGIRRRTGLYRRQTPEQTEAVRQQLRQFFEDQSHIDSVVRSYGKEHLYTYIRQKQINISRDAMYETYKEFYADEIERRKQRIEYRRSGWTTPGPNFVWSIDAYCKLEAWGFEVYAGIDAYSQFITWFYVGISANTARNVLAQYLYIVGLLGYIPQLLRSDRGKETVMACAAHFWLSLRQRTKQCRSNVTAEVHEEQLQFRDCCIYGKSTNNSRIESWWGQLCKGRAQFWRVRP